MIGLICILFMILFVFACIHSAFKSLRRSRELHEQELQVLREIASGQRKS